MCVDSASMDECLPPDIWEAILEKLDRQTLCTARLVSRIFCAAASANISSLTLRSPSQAVSLERFPRLGQVIVHHSAKDCSPAQLDPRLRAVITHWTDSRAWSCPRMTLPELPGMPKLRELDLANGNPICGCWVDGAEVLHSLTNLEVLRIGPCTTPVAMTIMTTSWLTALEISRVTDPGNRWSKPDYSFLQHATNLRQLQALRAPQEALPLIGNLTGLTGLTVSGGLYAMDDTHCIAPLSRLSRLRSLEIHPRISESVLAIAGSLGSGSLANLHVWVTEGAPEDCGKLLARQTALTRLSVGEEVLCDLRHMGDLRVESLQSLEIVGLAGVDAEGLDVLQKATSLTSLRIATCNEFFDLGLSRVLRRLTQLRCLQLDLGSGSFLDVALALGPLSALTKLQIRRSDDYAEPGIGEVRALVGLTGLQVLELEGCRLLDDEVRELAVLTKLRTLKLDDCGVTSLAPATNILNPLRQARGWPPVDAWCAWSGM